MEPLNELESWITDLVPAEEKDSQRDYVPILQAIAERVNHLLHEEPELLMSYLYRLDIDEKLVAKALFNPGNENVVDSLASLILDRQLRRIETKKRYGKPEIDEEGWSW